VDQKMTDAVGTSLAAVAPQGKLVTSWLTYALGQATRCVYKAVMIDIRRAWWMQRRQSHRPYAPPVNAHAKPASLDAVYSGVTKQ
jgi:hypothetical protein